MPFFDSHLHIIDSRFPLVRNKGYLPEEFTVNDYKTATQTLKMIGGAVVSGSFQAFDQSYLKDALQKLGKSFVGVTQVPHHVSDDELAELNQCGVRAIRFNLFRGGSESCKYLYEMATRVHTLFNWHVELYMDTKDLPELKNTLAKLPAFSIDHLGISGENTHDLFELVEKGARLKATGFGRIQISPIPFMKKIHALNPTALLFGTDLPSTRAPKPFSIKDITQINKHFSESDCQKIFYENALTFYSIQP